MNHELSTEPFAAPGKRDRRTNPSWIFGVGIVMGSFLFIPVAALAGQPVEPVRNPFAAEAWELPAELAFSSVGPGAEVLRSNCLLCHSMEYVTTQPVLTRVQWTGIVEKMRGKFGAVIPTNRVPVLVDALAAGSVPGASPR
jgi:hypothetical protein